MTNARKIVTVALIFASIMLFAVSASAAELAEVTFDGSKITVSGSCTTSNQVQVVVFDYNNQPIYFGTIAVAEGRFGKTLDAEFELEDDRTYTVKVADYDGKNVSAGTFTPHTHSFGTEWETDSTNHWHECSCGARSDEAAHNFNIAKSDATSHWHECVCGEKSGEAAHVYGTDWETDATNHWHECSCGARSDEAAHVYGTDWETDATNHWHECSCGARSDEAAHVYGTDWETDATNHWHECSCGAKADTAAHTYGEWTIIKDATATEDGSKERACTACDYKETAVIEATGIPETGDNGNLLLLSALIVISGGVITILAVSNKKRKPA